MTLNHDEFVICRNIPVPKKLIRDLQQGFGAVMIDDSHPKLLTALDRELQLFVLQFNRDMKDGEALSLSSEPLYWFKCVPLPVPVGAFIPGIQGTVQYKKKPIWFKIPKKFVVAS